MRHAIEETHQHPKYPRLRLERRSKSRFYQGLVWVDGKRYQKSLKTDQLTTALKLAEEWYRKLLRASKAHPVNKLGTDPTIGELFNNYKAGLDKSKRQFAEWRWGPIQHFWSTLLVSEVTTKTFKDYYAWRRARTKGIKPHTLHKDVVLIRQLLRLAIEEEHITAIPLVPRVGKIDPNPRPWLTRDEWKQLVKVGQARIDEAPNARTKQQRQDTLDLAVMIVATMCRVGEVLGLRFADCKTSRNARKELMLTADVNGKRGHRTIIAPKEAAEIVLRRFVAAGKNNDALVFPEHHRDAFRELLIVADLREDSKGFERNYKSLRATGISLRVLQPNPNLLMIARAVGTSVAMIDTYYCKRLTAEMNADELSRSITPNTKTVTDDVIAALGLKKWEPLAQ